VGGLKNSWGVQTRPKAFLAFQRAFMILYELFKGLPRVFYVIEVFTTLYIAHEAHLSPPEVTEVS
jgi:hypothetical protein